MRPFRRAAASKKIHSGLRSFAARPLATRPPSGTLAPISSRAALSVPTRRHVRRCPSPLSRAAPSTSDAPLTRHSLHSPRPPPGTPARARRLTPRCTHACAYCPSPLVPRSLSRRAPCPGRWRHSHCSLASPGCRARGSWRPCRPPYRSLRVAPRTPLCGARGGAVCRPLRSRAPLPLVAAPAPSVVSSVGIQSSSSSPGLAAARRVRLALSSRSLDRRLRVTCEVADESRFEVCGGGSKGSSFRV